MEVAIALGAALVGATATFVMHFLLMRKSQQQLDRRDARNLELAKSLDNAHVRSAALERSILVHETNTAELTRELDNKNLTIAAQDARMNAIEKAQHDLANAIKNHPGALPVAISGAFARLREEVSRAQAAATGTAAADQGSGKAGGVHEAVRDPDPR